MSILRRYTRKQEKSESENKSLKLKDWVRRLGMSMLALGYAAIPKLGEATQITGTGSSAPSINTSGNVTNIYAGSVKGQVAVNTFNEFEISQGHTANMHFNQGTSTPNDPTKLFNFVNDKISIDGTVNAIRANNIGGDLYFLSKQGMVVGASGVINAGSLTVLTPTNKWWEQNIFNPEKETFTVTAANVDAENISKLLIPINANGTISVLGNINANDSVRLKAATVNVGVKVEDDDSKTYHQANIKTGVANFAQIVNSEKVPKGTGLTLEKTTDGKIVLAAENSYNENNDNYLAQAEVNATVNVASGSKIIADGNGHNNNVEISAVATNNRDIKEYTKKVKGTDQKFYEINGLEIDEATYKKQYSDEKTNSFFFMDVTTNAEVNISGTSAADKTTISGERVDINAYAGNSFATNQNGLVSLENITDLASSILLNGWDVTVGVLNNTAKVDIGSNTVITAVGQDRNQQKALNIAAKADSNLELGTSILGLNLLSAKVSSLSLLPGVAVNYGVAHNNAIVNLAGNLEAEKGSTDIKAEANSVFHSTSTTSLPMGIAPVDGLVNLAFNDVKGTNTSTVNITNTANLTKLGNYVDIKANSTNDVNVTTNIAMGDKGLAAAGLSFTDYTSNATVNIDTAINAQNGIAVNAESLYTTNEIYTTADAGKTWLWSIISPYIFNSKTLDVISYKKFNGTLQDSIRQIANGTGLGNAFEDFANMAKLGVAYTSAKEGSHATVNIGSNGKLLAEANDSNISNITVAAQSIIRKNHVATIGTSTNNKDTSGKETADLLANGAIQSSTMDSSADIIFAGSTTEAGIPVEKLTADNIFLKANSESKYDRLEAMLDSISNYHEKADVILNDATNPKAYEIYLAYKKELAVLFDDKGKIKPEYSDIVSYSKKISEIYQTIAVKRYMELVENGKLSYEDKSGQTISVELSNAQTDSLHRCQDSMTGYFSFLSPESYMTYHVGSSTTTQADTPEDKEKASKLAAAVSVDFTSLNHNSNILLGKNVFINAKNNLNVESDTNSGDFSMDGKPSLNAGGKLFTAGVNVGVHNLNATSIVAVAENALLKAENTLEILDKNNISHIAINPALGMTDKIQLTGNLNFIYANSNTVISIDDEATLSGKNTKLATTNDTSIFDIVGSLAMAGNGAVGVAWNYNEINRNNIIAIADNDAVATMEAKKPEFADERAKDESKEDVHDADDAETRAKKLLAYNLNDEKFARADLFGSTTTTITGAEISAHQLKIDAQTIGSIEAVTADVGVVMQGDSEEPGYGDKFRAFKSNLSNRITNKIHTLDNKIADALGGTVFDQWDLLPVDQKAIASGAGKTLPTFTLDGSGSVGIVEMDAMTAAVVDNAKINLQDNTTSATDINNTVNVMATDNSSIVNVSGGVGFELNDYSHQVEGFSGSAWMFTGGVAYNDVKSDVVAEIKDSYINNADEIANVASREGALSSAAAAVNLQFSSGTQAPKGVGIAGGGSVNLADYSTAALMVNNHINTQEAKLTKKDTRKTSLINEAINKDLQVTGAIDLNWLDVDGSSIGIGAAVSRGYLQNTVKAELANGEYRKLRNLINNAVTDLTQIGAAVGGGVSISQQGVEGTNVAVQGAIAANTLENVVEANVKNATIDALAMDVKAYDTKLEKTQGHAEKIRSKYKLDTTGQAFINAAHKDANNEKLEEHGGTVVGAAVQILAAESSDASKGVGIGGSIVVNDLDNNYSALVDNVTLNEGRGTEATALNVMAETSNLVVGTAAGVGVVLGTSAYEATGNISENNIKGNVTSTVKNSSLNAADVVLDASNNNKFVNVAGSLTLSAKNGGISYALNKMDTKTGTYLFDTAVEHANGVALSLNAANNAKYLAVGAGIGASNTGINGSLGINFGNNNVEAVADGKHSQSTTNQKELKNIQKLTLTSQDDSQLVAVAGGFYVTSGDIHQRFAGASLGGAFAWNEVGHEDKEKKEKDPNYKSEQINKAELINYTITTEANVITKIEGSTETKPSNATINVMATDTAHITTIGAGVGIVGGEKAKGAIEGAGAYTKLKKDTEAYVNNVKVDDTPDKGFSLLNVTAHEENTITDIAAVVDAGKASVLLGAAVTYTDTNNNVKAHVNSSTINADNILVDANSKNDLTSVSAGGTVGSSSLMAGGSVTINTLADKVAAYIDGGTYTAKNNIGVTANGKEILKTGAGTIDLNVDIEQKPGIGVAAGLSLIKNDFTNNDVLAYVNNADLYAEGSQEDSYRNQNKGIAYHDSTTVNDVKKDSHKKPFEAVNQKGYGVVVDAYGKQDVTNVAVTAGIELAIDTPFTLDIAGSVALSEMGGNTRAYIYGSDINKDKTSYGDVIVTAYNEAELDDTAVNVDVSANISSSTFAANGAFGIAVAKEDSNRTVMAEVVGSSTKKTVNAENLKVKAAATNDIDVTTVGTTVNFSMNASDGVGLALAANANDNLVYSTNTIAAKVQNINGNNEGMDIEANHFDRIESDSVGVMVAANIPVSVESILTRWTADATVTYTGVYETNTISAALLDSIITHEHSSENAIPINDVVKANNYSDHDLASTAVAANINILGLGLAIDCINEQMTDTLNTTVRNSTITGGSSFEAGAQNKYSVDSHSTQIEVGGAVSIAVSMHELDVSANSSVELDNSTINANAININNSEERDIKLKKEQANIINAVSIGYARNYVTVNEKLNLTTENDAANTSEDAENRQEQETRMKNTLAKLDRAIVSQLTRTSTYEAEEKRTPLMSAEAARGITLQGNTGEDIAVIGMQTELKESRLTGNSVAINNHIQDGFDLYTGSGAGTILGVIKNRAILEEKNLNKVTVSAGTIDAVDFAINSDISGKAEATTALGYFSGVNANTSWAKINVDGRNDVEFNSITKDAKKIKPLISAANIAIKAINDGTYTSKSNGGGVTIVGGNELTVYAENKIDNKVDIRESVFDLKAKNESQLGNEIVIDAAQTSNVSAKTTFGDVSLVAGGTSYYVDAKLDSDNMICLTGNTITEGQADQNLILNALFAGKALVEAHTGSGSTGGCGSGTNGNAVAKGSATIDAQNNTFDITNLKAYSLVGGTENSATMTLAKADISAIDIGAALGADNNHATATVNTTSDTNFCNNTIVSKLVNGRLVGYQEVTQVDEQGNIVYVYELDAEGNKIPDGQGGYRMIPATIQIPVYEQVAKGKTNLAVKADTIAKADADIDGANVSLGIAVGHKEANVTVTENTNSTFVAKTDEFTYLKSLEVDSSGANTVRLHADGSGGGSAGISPNAATGTNNMDIATTTNVGGKINIDGNAEISAKQKDDIDFSVIVKNGGVISVGGANGVNTLTENTTVNVNGATIQAKEGNIVASNEVSMNPSTGKGDDNYAVEGRSGGAWDTAAGLQMHNTITDTATVEIINSDIQTADNLDVLANTVNNVNVKSIYSNGSLTFTEANAKVTNTHIYSNNINIDSDSSLKTTSAGADINLVAADDSNMQIGAYANAIVGEVSIAVPSTTNTLTRNNNIDIAGDVTSNNKLNIYSGDYTGIKFGGLDAVIDCEAYSGSFLPIRSRHLDSTVNQNNTVNISGATSSVADTDINATEGNVRIKHNYIRGSLFRTEGNQTSEYVSIDRVKQTKDSSDMESGLVHINTYDNVNITGSVIAGVNHKFKLDIGTPTEIVIVNDADRQFVNSADNDGATIVARPTLKLNDIELSEDAIKNKIGDIKYYSAGVASSILERYEEIEAAIRTYSDVDAAHKATDPTYQKLLLERESLISSLSQLGLAHQVEGQWIIVKDIVANVIELPDISSGGGNVIISSDDLVGDGTIKAYGSPELTINNYSNMYLKLNNVTVGELGGKIMVNDHDIDCTSTSTANSSISAALNQTIPKNFTEIEGDSSDSESKIDIQGINNIRTITGKYNDQTETVTPYASIELAKDKDITNKSGSVTIHSAHDSLFINGNVSGTTVTLFADEGNLTQISDKGILNIAGNPEDQYADKLNEAINNFGFASTSKVDPDHKYISKTYSTSAAGVDANSTTNGAITGSNIFLGGIAVNINGLVQSGYEEYVVNITDSSKITELDNSWNGTPLKDSEIMNSKYMLSQGMSVYDSTKGYCTYQMAAYYNPSTKKIVVPGVEAYGGNINISGNIMSTGNGKILAMDGTYDIQVNNTTKRDLQLGNLMATNVSGKITINDTAKGTKTEITKAGYVVSDSINNIETEYTRDGYTVTDYNHLTAEGKPTITTYADKDNPGYTYDDDYNPLENIRYNWNYGTYTASKVFKEHKYEANWWGIRESVDKIYNKGVVVKTEPNKTYNKEQVAYTSTDASLNDNEFYVFGSNNFMDQTKSDIKETRWKTGLFGFRKHILYEWNETTGSSQQYMASVKADNKINIGFMGKEAATINVNSFASVDMTGNIGSEQKNLATVNITSTNGHLTQNSSTILADNVNLQAAGHMQGIKISSGQELNLTVVNKATANTEYYYNGASTKVSDGNNIDITIKNAAITDANDVTDYGVVKLQGLIGNADKELVHSINIKTSGSIVQGTNGLIAGRRVDIEATNGKIGTATSVVKVDTGDNVKTADNLSASLNAKARGDINLEETVGDLRIGTIYSDNGDVTLKGAGSLVDALPYENIEASGRSDGELIAHWKSLGLIDDSLHIALDSQGKAMTTTEKNAYPVIVTKTVELEDGTTRFIKEQQKDAAGNPLYYQMEVTKGWDPNKLLYAISDEIVNPKSGVELPTKTANIKAHNINIEVGSSAGLNSDEIWERSLATLGNNLEDLKFLAKQDASNVQWNALQEDGTRSGKVVVQQKLPIGLLQSEGGTLTIKAGQNAQAEAKEIYVEARPVDAVHDTSMDMNIMDITTEGDVLLKNSMGGVYTAAASQSGSTPKAVINANKLDISAGGIGSVNGNIGTDNLPLYINITGPLHAIGTGNLNIAQLGNNNLLVSAVSAKGNISLTSDKGILGYGNASAEHTASGYIRLESNNTMLSLFAKDGNIGDATSGRISVVNKAEKDDERQIIAEAHHNNNGEDDGSVYLYGNQNPTTSAEPGGTLEVNSIKVGAKGTVDLDSFGAIRVNADNLNAKDVKLSAAKDVTVTAQNLHWDNVNITAGSHKTAESDAIKNYGGDVTITAESVELGTAGSGIKAAKAPGQLKGNVSVTATNAYLKNNAEISADGEIALQSAEQLRNSAKLQALGGKIDLLAGSDTIADEQTAATINNSGALSANGHITLKAYGEDLMGGNSAIHNTGSISSPASVELWSVNGGITNLGAIDGYMEHEGLPPKNPNSVVFVAQTNIYNGINEKDIDTIVRARSLEFTANTGSVNNFMNVVSTMGKAQITAGESVVNRGSLNAESAAAIIKARSFVENYGNMKAYDQVAIDAGENITNSGTMTAVNGSATIISEHGSIYNKDGADLFASKGNIIVETKAQIGEKKASIVNEGDLAANGDIILKSANGDVYNRDAFHEYNGQAVANGNISLYAPNGRVDNTQNLYAEETVNISAKEGLSNFSYDIYSKNIKGEAAAITLTTKEKYLINRSQLIAEKGDIVLNAAVEDADGGSVINLSPGDIFALGGNVTITAGASKNIENPEKLFVVNDLTSEVSNNVKLVDGTTVDLTKMLSDTQDYKDFKATHPNQDMIMLTEHDYGRNTTKIYYLTTDYTKGTEVKGNEGKVLLAEVQGVVDLFREGDVLNRGNIVALGETTVDSDGVYVAQKDSAGKLVGGNITIETKHGNLSNFDDLSTVYNRNTYEYNGKKYQLAEGSIKHSAKEGYYYNNMQLESGRDLYIEAQEDLVIGADGTDRITAGGTIHVISTEGSVTNKGKTDISAGESVIIEGYAGILNNGKVVAVDDISFKATEGDIVNKAELEAGNSVTLKAQDGSIVNEKNITAGGDVTVEAGANATLKGDVYSDGDTFVTAGNDALVNGSVNAGGDVAVEAGNTVTTTGEKLKAEGEVAISGTNGVSVDSAIEAGKNVKVEAEKGSVELKQNVEAVGNVAVDAGNTVITTGEKLKAEGEVAISGTNGVSVDSAIEAGKNVKVEAEKGSVELKQNVDADGNVAVEAGINATVGDNVVSGGYTSVIAGNDALVNGSVDAKGEVTVNAGNDATINDNVTSGANVTVKAQSIDVNGNVNAKNHILADATNGNLNINKSIASSEGGINLYATEGVINISKDADVESDGLLRIYAELKDQSMSQELADAVIAGGKLESLNGSVDIGAVNGNIKLVEVAASEMAAVGTKNGDVVLGDISAGTVVLYNHVANNCVEADNVSVGEALVVQSSKPVIKNIEATKGAKNIVLDITGAGGKVDPSGEINIGSITDPTDYVITNLAVGTAKVHTSGNISIGKLYVNGYKTSEIVAKQGVAIDSLSVKNKVYASGYDYDASVYGTIPKYDGSQAIYYDNSIGSAASGKFNLDLEKLFFGRLDNEGKYIDKQPAIYSVLDELKNLKPIGSTVTGEGMNLYITDSHNQTSNGKLLHVDDYHYVHNQRYSAEALSSILSDYKAENTFNAYYGDNLVLFERYNLYELPSVEIINGQLQNTFNSFVITKDEEEEKLDK